MPKATKANKSKTNAKHPKGSGYTGGAQQCLLDVVATLATSPQYSSLDCMPRDKIESYMKVQGINGASTIRNAVAKSKKAGLILVVGKDIGLTDTGRKKSNLLTDMSSSSNEEYQKKKIDEAKLNAKARMLLEYLKEGSRKKKDVLDELEMTTNSTWRNMISKLKKEGFIKVEADVIDLSDEMFPLGRD